ncbi:MAG: hypothetical protein HKM07_06930 [Chlamydiae bacterium]|jgi:hypothetical protein|nr:hypothetical protein [Chlamydiota bacterium]
MIQSKTLSSLPSEVYFYPTSFKEPKKLDFTKDTNQFSFEIEVGERKISITILGVSDKTLLGQYRTIEEHPVNGTIEFDVVQPAMHESAKVIIDGRPGGRFERLHWYFSFSDDFTKHLL